MVLRRCTLFLIIIFILLAFSGCATSSGGDEFPRYFEFTHKDQEIEYSMVAQTSDPEVIANIEAELSKPFDQRSMHINGDIARGNKEYNDNWSWYFIPGEWGLTEISTEVCDGRPGMVEDDLDYWVDQVGYFCPWNSRVLREVQP